jgi:hypothetical protein
MEIKQKQSILIAGGSGLIGRALIKQLDSEKYDITILTRGNPHHNGSTIHYVTWDPSQHQIHLSSCPDIIINLAGSGIADQRWTLARKQEILRSRVSSAETLENFLRSHNFQPKVYISASAIGFYGHRGEELLNETSPKGEGFMSDCCVQWEAAAQKAGAFAKRSTILRLGIVLSKDGGALPKMMMTRALGIYNYFGDGKQYYSWIHIDDVVNMIITSIEKEDIFGIYNAVSDQALTQRDFIKTCKHALQSKGIIMPIPKWIMKLVLGEMSAVVLDSTRVSAKKWREATGSDHKYPSLDLAIQNLYH